MPWAVRLRWLTDLRRWGTERDGRACGAGVRLSYWLEKMHKLCLCREGAYISALRGFCSNPCTTSEVKYVTFENKRTKLKKQPDQQPVQQTQLRQTQFCSKMIVAHHCLSRFAEDHWRSHITEVNTSWIVLFKWWLKSPHPPSALLSPVIGEPGYPFGVSVARDPHWWRSPPGPDTDRSSTPPPPGMNYWYRPVWGGGDMLANNALTQLRLSRRQVNGDKWRPHKGDAPNVPLQKTCLFTVYWSLLHLFTVEYRVCEQILHPVK